MSVRQGIEIHYRLFGTRGVIEVAAARLTGKPRLIRVETAGIAHPVQLRLRTTDASLFGEILATKVR